jgi:hypothetical protein
MKDNVSKAINNASKFNDIENKSKVLSDSSKGFMEKTRALEK